MPETSATLIEGIGDEVVLFAAVSVTFAVVALTALYFQYAFQRRESSRSQTPQQNLSPQSQHQTIGSHARSEDLQRETMSPVLHAPATLETTLQCERNTRLETREQIQEAEHDLEVNHGSLEDEEAPGDGSALRQRRLDFFERRERSESRGSSSAEELNPDAPLERSREGEQNESIAAATDGFPIRLKYLNDTERCVRGRPDETVGSFKRRHFATELESQRLVRLIFNGGQLRDDSAALSSCGLCSGCVVHVHISTAPIPPSDPGASSGEGELNLTALMWPLFATSLGILWVLHFQYGDLFNTSSTVVLVGISGLFCIGLYGQHYPQSPHTLAQEPDQRTGPPPGR